MVEIVTLPKLGISDTGDLVAWEKDVGDSVEAGDLLAVLESDKASVEVEADVAGTLLAIYVDEGEEIEIEPGRPIAAIGAEGEEAPTAAEVEGGDATEVDTEPTEATAGGVAAGDDEGASPNEPPGSATVDETRSLGAEPEKITPRAQRYAEEHDVVLAGIEGSGPEGSVAEADVKQAEAARAESPDTTTAVAAGDSGGAAQQVAVEQATADQAVPDAETQSVQTEREVRLTPRARRYAREHDVDLTTIEGTGIEGAVTESDLRRTVEGTMVAVATSSSDVTTPEETGSSAGEGAASGVTEGLTVTETRELTGTRKTIAERLSRSAREKPHVMGTREISIEALQRARERLAERGVDVSLNDLILRAVAMTLADLPAFNAVFENGVHSLLAERNIGYAVDTDRGLVVPVLEDVDERSLADLAERRQELVSRVLEGEHTADDLRGGTFTVTNVGVFDLDVSYSIINPPQVAILAIGRRKPTPVERDGEVEFETAITFSLTIDHRVLDGADTGRFLERLADYLEYPGLMLRGEL